jgi:galactosamine-6-phosphate isomerase
MSNGFRVVIAQDHEEMSRRAASELSAALATDPRLLLCAASGATPSRAYELLSQEARLRADAFRGLRVMGLDEWGGLGPEDAAGSSFQIRRQLIEPLALPADRSFTFRGDAPDPRAECARIAAILDEQGPIDVAVLGLGQNGHLGLNEPATELQPHAHVAELSPESRKHPMLASAAQAPRYGLTLGIADLLRARRVLLLVSGAHKRDVLARLVKGGITTALPGSLLRLHADTLCLCDGAAAAGLDGSR